MAPSSRALAAAEVVLGGGEVGAGGGSDPVAQHVGAGQEVTRPACGATPGPQPDDRQHRL
ncbi:hypothetical protein [Rhodococcus marinonascens]|uniref:hypothetical protein n=1 Tax=Rhodococcus marinonascens TaxID=38311 RepID=UPI0011148018|nr:hypothetical protein [Rhodococcus marinonascens]